MAKAYLSGGYGFPKNGTVYWGDIWIKIKTRPNRTFRYCPLICGLADLNTEISIESELIKTNPDYETNDYDDLVQVREELKENPIVIRTYKKVSADTIWLDVEKLSRYDVEVGLRKYLKLKGHDIKSIKWIRK